LYDKIGYGTIKSDLFRHLVVSRLFSSGSKLKTIDYLERYQGITYTSDKEDFGKIKLTVGVLRGSKQKIQY